MHLEMEIFRQLQMDRRDNRPSDSSDVYAVSGPGSSGASSSSSANPNSLTSSNVASISSPSSVPSSRMSADSRQLTASSAVKSIRTHRPPTLLAPTNPSSDSSSTCLQASAGPSGDHRATDESQVSVAAIECSYTVEKPSLTVETGVANEDGKN